MAAERAAQLQKQIAYQLSAWRKRDTISERGKRGDWEKFNRVMAKVKDVPPLLGDEK